MLTPLPTIVNLAAAATAFPHLPRRHGQGGRPRVLLIAEACNPAWVSIPLEGWSLYAALREVADVHLVTQVRNRGDIEATGLTEGRDFTAIDSEKLSKPIYNLAVALRGGQSLGWTTQMALSAISYPYFERLIWQKFGHEIESGRYDLVHRLTPVSPTLPSPIARHCHEAGVPFLLGPLNGGIPWPKAHNSARLQEREYLTYLRDAYKLQPAFWSTLRHAAKIVCGSQYTLSQIPPQFAHKATYIPENAIDPTRFTIERTRKAASPGPLKVVFTGRLVPYKGPDLLLEAAAPLIRQGKLHVTILGDGPLMPKLKDIVAGENLDGGTTIPGRIPHTQLQSILADQDLFAFPSIREFGGAVVIEAMAMGLVPLIVDYGGPAELISDDTGFRIPMAPRDALIQAFRTKLTELEANRTLLDTLSPKAKERAFTHFTWQAKAHQFLHLYQSLLRA